MAQAGKVLIIEDEPIVALSLREVLSSAGYVVVGIARNVGDALSIAQSTLPDLVVCDVQLTGRRDGVEGAVLLQDIHNIPVVFLTAQGDQETRARAAAVQPVAYLHKPVSVQQVLAAVEQGLRKPDQT
jgi:DNA-binding response OmpR family regulator